MAPRKPKIKKKPMTLENIAVLIQRDLARMATKEDLQDIRQHSEHTSHEMRKGFAATNENFRVVFSQLNELREDLKQTTNAMVSKADLANAIEREFESSSHGRLLRTLESRVDKLEEKLGGKPAPRRA